MEYFYRNTQYSIQNTARMYLSQPDLSFIVSSCNRKNGAISYFCTPLEVRILHKSSIPELSLKQLMCSFIDDRLEQNVQITEVVQCPVIIVLFQIGVFTEGTDTVVYRPLCYCQSEISYGTVPTAVMFTFQHGHLWM